MPHVHKATISTMGGVRKYVLLVDTDRSLVKAVQVCVPVITAISVTKQVFATFVSQATNCMGASRSVDWHARVNSLGTPMVSVETFLPTVHRSKMISVLGASKDTTSGITWAITTLSTAQVPAVKGNIGMSMEHVRLKCY